MDVHTLINGLAAEIRLLKADMAEMKVALGEVAAAMKKPEPAHPPKKGGD